MLLMGLMYVKTTYAETFPMGIQDDEDAEDNTWEENDILLILELSLISTQDMS